MIPLEWSDDGRTALFGAYAKAQAGMGDVVKDANNPHFSSKYATLSAVIAAVIPSMSANGLGVIQSPSFDGEVLTVETVVVHGDGGWMKSTLNVIPGKPDAQGLGSAITYLRRYALMSLAGVAPEDDDGNAASASGSGGKKFSNPASQSRAKPVDNQLEAFIWAMKLNKTLEAVDAWAAKEAGAITEKLSPKDRNAMQDAYAEYRNDLAAKDEPKAADVLGEDEIPY